jgi:Trypsin-co-occurring domain 2
MTERPSREAEEQGGEITEAVEQLREQLLAAQRSGEGKGLRFVISEVEMEFVIEVRKEGGGRAGITLGVVEVGGGGKMSHGAQHRLKIQFDVTGTDGGPAAISDRR